MLDSVVWCDAACCRFSEGRTRLYRRTTVRQLHCGYQHDGNLKMQRISCRSLFKLAKNMESQRVVCGRRAMRDRRYALGVANTVSR